MWDLGLSELLFFSSMSAPASAPASVFVLAFFVGFKTWETLYVYGRLLFVNKISGFRWGPCRAGVSCETGVLQSWGAGSEVGKRGGKVRRA